MQHASSFQNHSNDRIMRELACACRDERRSLARILRLIGEVDRRRLYAPLGYSSLFQYCTEVLAYSENEAYLRIGVARAGRRYPLIIDMIERGDLHLSGAARCAPQLTDEDYLEILQSVANKSKREIEEILAARFPQPDMEDSILPVSAQDPRHVVAPLAEDRFYIGFTASRRCCELLERAKELTSHRKPRPGFEQLMEAALALYVEKLEKQKHKTTDRPQQPSDTESEDPRHIPAHVKREVYRRDGGRCTYVGDTGHRCCARAFLEYDHIVPVARGGKGDAWNLRLRCSTHNQLTARRELGEQHVSLMAHGFRPSRQREAYALALDMLRPRGSTPARSGTSGSHSAPETSPLGSSSGNPSSSSR